MRHVALNGSVAHGVSNWHCRTLYNCSVPLCLCNLTQGNKMSKASARRMRRKAYVAHVHASGRELQALLATPQPLPSTLVPIAEWHVQIRELPEEGSARLCWQRFAAMPATGGKVWLCINPARGARRIGQWPFATWQQAMAYSQQIYTLNGCAVRA